MNETTTGLRLALGTLTIVPVGDLPTITPNISRRAMLLAPVATLPLGVGVAALLALAQLVHLAPPAAGLLSIGFLAYATRAMHLDGLADTVDGFGAGWSRDRALAVMKSGDIGPMGVSALIVSLGLQVVGFSALTESPLLAGAAVVCSRCACTAIASRRLASARGEGLGSAVAGTVPDVYLVLVTLLGVAVLTLSGWADGQGWIRPLVGAALAALAICWVARRSRSLLGGVSGDVFGAAVELSLTAILLPFACGGVT